MSNFQCTVCNLDAQSKEHLERHLSNVLHLKNLVKNDLLSEEACNCLILMNGFNKTCETCHRQFNCVDDLIIHWTSSHSQSNASDSQAQSVAMASPTAGMNNLNIIAASPPDADEVKDSGSAQKGSNKKKEQQSGGKANSSGDTTGHTFAAGGAKNQNTGAKKKQPNKPPTPANSGDNRRPVSARFDKQKNAGSSKQSQIGGGDSGSDVGNNSASGGSKGGDGRRKNFHSLCCLACADKNGEKRYCGPTTLQEHAATNFHRQCIDQTASKQALYQCKECDVILKGINDVMAHVNASKQNDNVAPLMSAGPKNLPRVFVCKICDVRGDRNFILMHLSMDNHKTNQAAKGKFLLECFICNKVLHSNNDFIDHLSLKGH